ncbi:hypothetical protein C8R47DRAFT_1216393 [Mycena vitilis]|nr:hypothetical protein C8R47DRAFT_1216393 [Mycena vitilis]
MSCTTELRARIAELSSTIEIQKQVLRDLEVARANARRELNATCDPMARLPFELSSDSEVFALCLPDQPGFDDIARSTPSLWSTVHCDHKDAARVEIWLSRARNLPLELYFSALSSEVVSVIKRHASQVQRLDLRVEHSDAKNLRQMTTCTRLPALEKLEFRGPLDCYHEGYFEMCLATLRVAPALVECDLIGAYEPTYAVPLTHPCLRHLRLGRYRRRIDQADDAESGAGFLRFLTLPALENLFIDDLDIPEEALPNGDLDIQFLHSVPTLTSLTLDFLSFDTIDIYGFPAVAVLATASFRN